MKKGALRVNYSIITVFVFMGYALSMTAQVPDDINGRLWRLCKAWGYAKYYHPNNCEVDWNELLLTALDSTLNSSSNSAFNETLSSMLEDAGLIPHAAEPLIYEADYNLNAHFEWISDPLFSANTRELLDSIQINYRPRPNCMLTINDYSDPNYNSYIDFRSDNIDIIGFTYNNESHRLAVLFYYWNIINYFHADKSLMDQNWDTTLFQFIPLIRTAANITEFQVQFLRLVTYIDDSHGFTRSAILDNFFGSFYPKIKIQYIEGKTVVTKTDTTSADISIGDVVKKINGLEIEYYRDSMTHYIAASNEGGIQRQVHDLMIRGPFNSTMNIELENQQGEIYNTGLRRINSLQSYYSWSNADLKPIWEITECGYGYVNMGKLLPTHVSDMYNDLKDAPAIIFDVRNYPNGTNFDLMEYLLPEPTTFALLGFPDLTYPGWYNYFDTRLQFEDFSNPDPYSGKVFILANSEAQSHAEYTIMGLQQHPQAFTIGSETAGADGNVSFLNLPGSILTYWTSLGVFYPDSITAQRVGVRIDSIVTPTISGIRSRKDELLEAAFDCLTNANHDVANYQDMDVFPNPANELLYISADLNLSKSIEIEIFDMLGHLVFQRTYPHGEHGNIPIDVSQLVNGFYFVSLKDNYGASVNRKILVQH